MSPLSAAVRRAALLCVLFAAIFVAGVTLSPCASAQQPGGVGGSSDGSATGWVPQPRPGVTNPQSYADYDWTGLDGTVGRSPFTGSYPPETYHNYGGSEGFSTSGSYFLEYPFNGTGGTGNTLAEVSTQFSGTTTYKWKWVPPNNAAGQPDTANFPVPTLFTLYDMYATLDTQLWSPPNNSGLAASGTVSDGPPDNWSASVSTVPQMITDVFPRRMVLPGSAPDSGGVSSVAMALSGNLDVTGKQSVVVDGRTGPGAMCISAATVNGQADPITLAAPDPLTNPLLGDGTNQFVYDAEQPDGYLAVPASISVPGAGTADTAFLLPHVALSVAPAMQTGAQPFQWTNSGSQMYIYTPGNYPSGTSYPSAAFIYKGLPPNNSYFGNHTMTMKVDGTVSQTANYQLFFNGTATNHPNPDGNPNWYYYYTQVYNPFSGSAPGVYTSGSQSHTHSTYPFQVYVEDDAYTVPFNVPVFDKGGGGFAHWRGYLAVPSGILDFVYTAAHERGHQIIFQQGNAAGDGPIYSQQIGEDGDGDGVLDSWEDNHNLDRYSKDTTCAYDYSAGGALNGNQPGDREFLADIQALPVIFNQLNTWRQDWADAGIQRGILNTQPAFSPLTNPLTFQLAFTPVTVNIQNHSWVALTNQTQWVSSISGIQAIIGTPPLTRLSDLGP